MSTSFDSCRVRSKFENIMASLVQDDFLMAREREDGKIYLVGGLIAFPGPLRVLLTNIRTKAYLPL